jgi:hypothetical protein
MAMKTLSVIIFFILSASIAFSQAFKWVDEKGNVHFTDDYSQIPEKYRPGSERRGMPAEAVEPKLTEKDESKSSEKVESKSSETPSSEKKEDIYKDRLGRGEDYWRGTVKQWRTQLATSQNRVDALRIKYNELTEKYNHSKNSLERTTLRKEREEIRAEMNQHKDRIEEAKVMLEKKIPEEAELYKAKPEWIK